MINPNNKTYSGLVASDDSQPENKVHFFYNSGVHLGPKQWQSETAYTQYPRSTQPTTLSKMVNDTNGDWWLTAAYRRT